MDTMSNPLDLNHLQAPPACFQPSTEFLQLREAAHDIDSSVVITGGVIRVDGLEFSDIAAALAHCREVA
jgi:hypothetical protein